MKKGMIAGIVFVSILSFALSGCSSGKDNRVEIPSTTKEVVSPSPSIYPTYKPKETPSETTNIPIETQPIVEPTAAPTETPDIPKPTPTAEPKETNKVEEPSDESLIAKATAYSIELGYRTKSCYYAWVMDEISKCTISSTDDSHIKVSFLISNSIDTDEQQKAIKLLFDEILGITSYTIDKMDNSLDVVLDSNYWSNSIELYRIQTSKELTSDKSKVLTSSGGLEIGYVVYNPYGKGLKLDTEGLMESAAKYSVYHWINKSAPSSIYFTDPNKSYYILKYTIQNYEEYKYSWNGIENSTFDSPHFIEIDSIRVNLSTSDVKVYIPNNPEPGNQVKNYQFFISLYKDILSDAYSISSSGESEIACYMSQNSYYSLIDKLKSELNAIDTGYTTSLGQVINISKSDIDKNGEDYICKALTLSYLYNRMLGNSNTTATVNILDDSGECEIRYEVTPKTGNKVTKTEMKYDEGLSDKQSIMQSELYKLEGNPDTMIPKYPTIEPTEDSLNKLSTEDCKPIINILKDTIIYSTDGSVTIAVIVHDTEEQSIKSKVNQIYTLYSNIWKWDNPKWEVKEDNTIRLIISPTDFSTYMEQTLRAYDDYCYKVIGKIFDAKGYVGLTEELPSTIVSLDTKQSTPEIDSYIYRYAVCDFIMASIKSVNSSQLRQINVEDIDGNLLYTISNFI